MIRLVSALALAFALSAALVPAAQATGRTVGERVDDAKITAAVKTKLTADNLKNLVKVDVDTRDGVVHLQGTVSTAAGKAEAERLAKQTNGVRRVVNDLRVQKAAASRDGDAGRTAGERVDDGKITAAVKTKLTADNLKNLVKVDVDTRDGVVHLQGTVPTAADKAEAERRAKATDGVRRVVNDLRVEGAATGATTGDRDAGRTAGERVDDGKITAAVKTKLTADNVKNLVKVDVDTRDGVVHLQGTVPTAADKAEAERRAKATDGVRRVVNDLRVEGAATGAATGDRDTGRTAGERVDDAKITAAVKTKLTADNLKNLVKVNVDTRDGVVHLQGTVPTAAAKAEAERLAKDTDGVRRVVNDLRVEAAGASPSASPRQ